MKKKPLPPELSRLIDADKPDRTYSIVPTAEEVAAVAKRLSLLRLEDFSAELSVKRGSGGTITVRGPLKAKVAQSCVVTLEPVDAVIDEEIVATFSEQGAGPDEQDWNDDADAPERIDESGKIDLGELAVQHLSLALDPYPRKEGAEFAGYDDPI